MIPGMCRSVIYYKGEHDHAAAIYHVFAYYMVSKEVDEGEDLAIHILWNITECNLNKKSVGLFSNDGNLIWVYSETDIATLDSTTNPLTKQNPWERTKTLNVSSVGIPN